jgi:DNA-binding response OmpR family regulator
MSKSVLLVEDEEKIRRILKDIFTEAGFHVIEAENGRIGLDIFNEMPIDLIILDIMLPQLDGWSVCRKIRKTSDIPIIILTARSDEDDKLMGFELGADEYVTKPFSPLVLVARAQRLLERVSGSTLKANDILKEGAIEINKRAYIVKINNEEIPFTPKEYEILIYLIENKGTVLTRDVLINSIWGYDYYGDDRIVDAHIKKIRKKMGLFSEYIHTVLRVGYKFEVKE